MDMMIKTVKIPCIHIENLPNLNEVRTLTMVGNVDGIREIYSLCKQCHPLSSEFVQTSLNLNLSRDLHF